MQRSRLYEKSLLYSLRLLFNVIMMHFYAYQGNDGSSGANFLQSKELNGQHQGGIWKNMETEVDGSMIIFTIAYKNNAFVENGISKRLEIFSNMTI